MKKRGIPPDTQTKLAAVYPDHTNPELAVIFNASCKTIAYYGRKFNLKKSAKTKSNARSIAGRMGGAKRWRKE